MPCKAGCVDSFDDAVARVPSQAYAQLMGGLLRECIESVTLFKRREPSASIVPVTVSVL